MWANSGPAGPSPATTGRSSSTRSCGPRDATSCPAVHRNHADARSFVTLGPVVSIIEREPEAVEAPAQPPVEDAAPAVEPAPERLCSECSAPLQPDQDWCLECGTAQPDRPGARPGWRTAAAVLATTGVLASGAVAAAYAGLSADAKKAAAPNAQAALPPQPPAAAPPAPATPPAATPPAATTPPPAAPKSTPPPAVKPPAPTPPASTAAPPAAKPSTST